MRAALSRFMTANVPSAVRVTPHAVFSQPWRCASLASRAGTIRVMMVSPRHGRSPLVNACDALGNAPMLMHW